MSGIKNSKKYLGDGVYVDLNDSFQIVLTTENGIEATNEIYLDDEIIDELIKWRSELYAKLEGK